MHID